MGVVGSFREIMWRAACAGEIRPLEGNVPSHRTSPGSSGEGVSHAAGPLPCAQRSLTSAAFPAEQGREGWPGFFRRHCGMDDCVASR